MVSLVSNRFVLLFGNTQVGKSTFINHLKGKIIALAGDESGRSTTTNVTFYLIGPSRILYPNDPESSLLYLIDIPGLRDTALKITDEEILEAIKFKLFELNCDKLDAVLLFESVKSSAMALRTNLSQILKVFGKNIQQTILAIITKWDDIDEDEANAREKNLNNLKNISFIKWINQTPDNELSTELKSNQYSLLVEYLSRLFPYRLEDMKRLDEECEKRAYQIREMDPDRYRDQVEEYDDNKIDEYSTDEEYEDFEPKYKDEESINSRAHELQKAAGMRPVIKQEIVNEEVKETFTDIETRETITVVTGGRRYIIAGPREKQEIKTVYHVPVQREKIVSKPKNVEKLVNEYYPIENFRQQAINERIAVNKIKRVKKQRLVNYKNMKISKVENHDFSFYLEKAKKTMLDEYRQMSSL
ncbi:hypothetical protein SteCoe_9335 [Stentor coeruleus]|uniref:G domain-containing protein n=1 Tax=Stentor coeruleus TaxID=5963 RepID=A0A1R2CI63_9CILI|nr:hypothetical protein SteCoe_9335 [Stentor coeruleus]